MALTNLQRRICRLVAGNRIASGESYLAGAAALNELVGGARLSRDIDIFHDTEEAVAYAWAEDRRSLEAAGYGVRAVREVRSYVEAEVGIEGETVRVEWARDSAYRFFPLVQNEAFGLVLHPFDLATNKVLALVGRLEVRDWVDVIASATRVQPLGYLAWAASGKDPGFGPRAILEHAARTSRYSADEVATLSFDGQSPDAGDLSRTWRGMLVEASETVDALPPAQAGTCVLTAAGGLFHGNPEEARTAVAEDALVYHRGTIRGALPRLLP